jgi:ribonuclease HI
MPKFRKIKIISDACCRVPSDPGTGFMRSKGKSACGFVMLDEENKIIAERAKYLGELTAPQAEYEGLIFALDTAVEFCRQHVEIWMDSDLVIKQMNGDYCIRSEHVKPLFDEVKKLENRFLGQVNYFHHDRGSFWARHADRLANEEYSRNQTG